MNTIGTLQSYAALKKPRRPLWMSSLALLFPRHQGFRWLKAPFLRPTTWKLQEFEEKWAEAKQKQSCSKAGLVLGRDKHTPQLLDHLASLTWNSNNSSAFAAFQYFFKHLYIVNISCIQLSFRILAAAILWKIVRGARHWNAPWRRRTPSPSGRKFSSENLC